MLERTSLLKIAMAAVFAASLAALPLTLRAQESSEPASKSDPAAKAKKKATTKAAAKSKTTETAPAEPTDPLSTTTDAKGKQLSPGQIAVRERQRKCGAEWRGLSKDEQAKKGGTWPKYWSACNTRLKGDGQAKGKK